MFLEISLKPCIKYEARGRELLGKTVVSFGDILVIGKEYGQMPRTNMCKPSELVRIEQELREQYKGARYISTAEIGRMYSIRKYAVLYELLSPYKPLILPSGRKRWKIEDVARMEYMRRI